VSGRQIGVIAPDRTAANGAAPQRSGQIAADNGRERVWFNSPRS